jgi:hypothetical protein
MRRKSNKKKYTKQKDKLSFGSIFTKTDTPAHGYINGVKFMLVYYKNFVLSQSMVYLEELKKTDISKNSKSNSQYEEYYLHEKPIKVSEYNGQYWIVDGYHRFYKGLLLGYKYFLVENYFGWNPSSFENIQEFNIYEKRPEDNVKFIEVDKFSNDDENIIKQFISMSKDKFGIFKYKRVRTI